MSDEDFQEAVDDVQDDVDLEARVEWFLEDLETWYRNAGVLTRLRLCVAGAVVAIGHRLVPPGLERVVRANVNDAFEDVDDDVPL